MTNLLPISGIISVYIGAHATSLVIISNNISGSTSLAFDVSASAGVIEQKLSGSVSLTLETSNRGGIRYLSEEIALWTVETRLYQPDGLTFITVLPKARKVQFQMENSKPGSATFELPVHDDRTKLVEDDMIVKFSWAGRERFGCVVKTVNCTLTTDDETWISYSNQPGVLSLFSRAPVMPEYLVDDRWKLLVPKPAKPPVNYVKLPKNAGSDRLFGFMSKWSGWGVGADWVTPIAQVWNTPGSAKGPNPPVFSTIDPKANWIAAPPGPTVSVPEGTIQYFRSSFTVDGVDPKVLKLYTSGDNFATVYIDGELLITPDMDKPLSWLSASTIDVTLAPGTHLIAASVLNGGVAVAPPLVIAKTNVNLSSIPNPILGVTLSDGDRVLLTKQTTASQNGTYVFYKAVTSGSSQRPNRLIKSSAANPVAFLGSLIFMMPVTGQPASNIVKEVIAGDVQFDNNQYNLDAGDKKALIAISKKMAIVVKPVIVIEGHASSEGSEDSNMTLSVHRAEAVWDYLKSQLRKRAEWSSSYEVLSSTPGGTVTVRGYGEERLQYTPGTNPKNRRVEIAYPVLEPGVSAGDVLKPVVMRRTDTENWKANDGNPVPGWYRALVIKQLLKEAQEQNIEGLDSISVAYTDTAGYDKKSWIHPGQFSFPLITTNLQQVVETLTEDDLDIELDAATMQLRAWQRRGQDLTVGDHPVRLMIGHGLTSYETTRTSPLATVVIGRLTDGTWFELQDNVAYEQYGRRAVGLSVSSAVDEKTARAAAQTILDENSAPVVTLTAQTSASVGPQPMVDYDIGDTVLTPGHKGEGTMPARCMSITVDATGEAVKVYSEFVVDTSAPVYALEV